MPLKPGFFWTHLIFAGFTHVDIPIFFDTSGGTTSLYRELFFNKPLNRGWNGLYDRQTNPHGTNNVYAVTQYAGMREQLHKRTLEWMKQFGDQGVPYQTLEASVYTPADREARENRDWDAFSGVLKRRPIDLLNECKSKSTNPY